MNDTLRTIAERYSCRDFDGAMPSQEKIEAIAQAAIQAPSGMNRQHWHIIVIKNKDIISEIEAESMRFLSKMDDKTMYERIKSRGGKLFYNAPCLILIAVKEAYPKGAELIDLGIVAQNISIAATSLGIANLHCGLATLAFAGDKASELKAKLKVPEEYECGIGVLLGYGNSARPPHDPDYEKICFIE